MMKFRILRGLPVTLLVWALLPAPAQAQFNQ
jgi:hypothetical protein